jgi:hypothetical protein
MPSLGQMAGHRPTHDAKSDKSEIERISHYCGL